MRDDLRFLILVEGQFGPLSSKTANSCIRYTPGQVAAVLDSAQAGKTVQDVLGFGGAIPVVRTLEEGLARRPTALLIGVAPQGGQLPPEWHATILGAIDAGLDVWSGLHSFLGNDQEFVAHAQQHGVALHDLRRPPDRLRVSKGRVRGVEATVVLTVGTDCNIGKMTSALQLRDGLRSRGRAVRFAGTGQTGILIEGWGIAVDAVIADFIGGAAERLVLDASTGAEIVLVEGQGSLVHPGYSGVTLGLLHGALPHALVLCSQPSRTTVTNNPWLRIPSLTDTIALHDAQTRPLRHAPVIAVCLNTYDLSEQAARDAIARAQDETGLPATDPVRYDPAPIVDAIDAFHRNRSRKVSPQSASV